jgi:AraC family transcriptional regulator
MMEIAVAHAASRQPDGLDVGLDLKSSDLVTTLLAQALEAFQLDVGTTRECVQKAAELLGILHKEAPAARRNQHGKGGLAWWQVLQVTRYVDTFIEQSIRVVELAEIARLSKSYFSKAFRRSFGMSPHSSVTARRIAHANMLILETEETLCTIALACGFTDQAHLSRHFRRETGSAPNAWRRRISSAYGGGYYSMRA